MEVLHEQIYDYPNYYDVLFGADWRAEFKFLRACFENTPRGRCGGCSSRAAARAASW